jgi:membrane-associated phospholipid phosphatase
MLLLSAILAVAASPAYSQSSEVDQSGPPAAAPAFQSSDSGVLSDIPAYFTAPLHWSSSQWTTFGFVMAGVGVAHIFDGRLRKHFVHNLAPGELNDSHDGEDAAPTGVALVGTFAVATFSESPAGQREAGTMLEAALLGGVTAYGLQYAFGREGPNTTSDPNEWGQRHSPSFPSVHATAAFAVGTVLAESGPDDYRWVRRFLGYGLGFFTDYERLKHNAHWFSDVVAGSALGTASAQFTMNRRYQLAERLKVMLVPVDRGAKLTCQIDLP